MQMQQTHARALSPDQRRSRPIWPPRIAAGLPAVLSVGECGAPGSVTCSEAMRKSCGCPDRSGEKPVGRTTCVTHIAGKGRSLVCWPNTLRGEFPITDGLMTELISDNPGFDNGTDFRQPRGICTRSEAPVFGESGLARTFQQTRV